MDAFGIMKEFGFSKNEAKCYIALLKKSPMTGYEVAKVANITRTMVYDTLKRLERKNAVLPIEGTPRRYAPVNYRELIANMKKDYDMKMGTLQECLDDIEQTEKDEEYVLNMASYDELVHRVEKGIDEASGTIFLSLWDKEAKLFEAPLRRAYERGVEIHVFSFCPIPFDFGHHYSYNMTDARRKFPRRRLIAIFDRKDMVVGDGNNGSTEIRVYTKNKALLSMAMDQILLDIILYYALKNQGYLGDNVDVHHYNKAIQSFFEAIQLPKKHFPFEETEAAGDKHV